jgi:hypothetical protein
MAAEDREKVKNKAYRAPHVRTARVQQFEEQSATHLESGSANAPSDRPNVRGRQYDTRPFSSAASRQRDSRTDRTPSRCHPCTAGPAYCARSRQLQPTVAQTCWWGWDMSGGGVEPRQPASSRRRRSFLYSPEWWCLRRLPDSPLPPARRAAARPCLPGSVIMITDLRIHMRVGTVGFFL